jgi:hypothetical protein
VCTVFEVLFVNKLVNKFIGTCSLFGRGMACTDAVSYPLVEKTSCDFNIRISVTYSECLFVSLSIQHATHTRHIFSTARPTLQYLSTLSHKQYGLRKQLLNAEYDVCFATYFTKTICQSKKN